MSTGKGASIVRGDSAEAVVDAGYEEVVTSAIPVSEGGGVVEQGVQGHVRASDQESFAGEDRQRQHQM